MTPRSFAAIATTPGTSPAATACRNASSIASDGCIELPALSRGRSRERLSAGSLVARALRSRDLSADRAPLALAIGLRFLQRLLDERQQRGEPKGFGDMAIAAG